MDDFDFNITIVGLGLVGGSFAMALKELNPKNLWGIDIDENILKKAESLKIIDKGYLEFKTPLQNSDIVIICLYPKLTIEFIKNNMDNFKQSSIIIDTAGIKNTVLENINSFIRDDIDFIGTHPMAGRENSGLDFASRDIFIDANYIITPTNKNKLENINIIEDMVKKIGCKNIVKVDAKKHDEIMAYTSQLPHIIASSIANSNVYEDAGLFAGGSFRGATRVADMNSNLWIEILMDNKVNIIQKISEFENVLAKIKIAIEQENEICLKDIFERGREKL